MSVFVFFVERVWYHGNGMVQYHVFCHTYVPRLNFWIRQQYQKAIGDMEGLAWE